MCLLAFEYGCENADAPVCGFEVGGSFLLAEPAELVISLLAKLLELGDPLSRVGGAAFRSHEVISDPIS